VLDTTVRVGEGLSGWVARNRRILVNAAPVSNLTPPACDGHPRPSAIVCPLYLGDAFIEIAGAFPHGN